MMFEVRRPPFESLLAKTGKFGTILTAALELIMKQKHPMRERILGSDIPPIIHLLNIIALLLGILILLLAAVATAYQLIALVPVLALLVAYWRVRTNPSLVAGYFVISIVLLGWILVCENLVVIDNVFDTLISQRLSLGLRLLGYVDANLQ